MRAVKNMNALLAALLLAAPMAAKDRVLFFPIEKARQSLEYREKMRTKVQFHFGDPADAPGGASFGYATVDLKTSILDKTDEESCNRVFLSCMIALRKKADSLHTNAVIGITSVYGGEEMVSDSLFECHLGSVAAGVALRGNFINIIK
jgi:hypothetical protein